MKANKSMFRKYVKYLIILSMALLSGKSLFAQDPKTELEKKIEKIAEQTDAELDYTQLLEQLYYYEEHPLNLNKASREDLAGLVFLNGIQITNLLEHISKNGKLLSIYELQSIDGFDQETISNILPFVKVSEDAEDRAVFNLKDIKTYGKHTILVRGQQMIEDQQGFSPISDSALAASPNSRYLGTKPRIYTRYRFTYGQNISFGITGEKDQGEEFLTGTQKNGFDFYSAHLFIRKLGVVKTLAIGDFSPQFGQGLTFWNGFSFGKSNDVVNIKKNAMGLRPYTSSDENKFMRGVGTTLQYKNAEVTAFYSAKKIDANITQYDSINQEILGISSLQVTGYHSTPGEIADKDAIKETILGGNISWNPKQFHFGVTAVSEQYSSDLKGSSGLYNQFDFTGDHNFVAGADYAFTVRNIHMFGEVSRSESGGMAWLNGAMISPSAKLSFSVLQRHYDKNFQNLYASAFAESSSAANETGIFYGVFIKPNKRWTIVGYFDMFSFPWLTYSVDKPSNGFDCIGEVNYKPSKKTEMYVRYRQEKKGMNIPIAGSDDEYGDIPTRQSVRYNISYKVSPSFTLKNRVEYLVVNPDGVKESGFLLSQDISYKPMKKPFALSFRYAIFETDSYASAIWIYEQDVLYGYSIPALYYRGVRTYLNIKFNISKNTDCWLRIAQTYFDNQSTIGTGLTQINGNTKTEAKVQFRFKF
ncbi:MAG: helix-hairpin-helix domain-containing protein [Bacteroidota bacterium]